MKTKEKLSYVLITILLLGGVVCLKAQVAVAPESGDGSPNTPYRIATLENLYWIAASDEVVPDPNRETRWSSHYIQTANINATETHNWFEGKGWIPIGDGNHIFTGYYNGQDHTINSLFINRPQTVYVGLFGRASGPRIENIGVTNVDITGYQLVGGLVGRIDRALIRYCHVTGIVSGEKDSVGGLFGRMDGVFIRNSFSAVNVSSGSYYVGGLVGHARSYPTIDTIIRACYSTGFVVGGNNVGGLVGDANNITIDNSYSTGSVTGEEDRVGGLVGSSTASTINNSFSTGNVTGEESRLGGLTGYNGGTLRNSYYNYEQVLINGENVITTGALDDEMFTVWQDNDLSLDIDEYLDYDGSSYLINSVNDFKKLLAFGQFEEYSYKLTVTLDLEDHHNFYIPYFTGDFDGNDFLVTNLSIDLDIGPIGLFGTASGAKINNLGVDDADINGRNYTGVLVGLTKLSTVITSCYVTGSVTGDIVGGLVGYTISNTTINNCYSIVNVTGNQWVGGLAGCAIHTIISNCYSAGNVAEEGRLIGGLVGRAVYATINSSYWDTIASGQITSAGGTGRTTDQMTYPYDEDTYVGWDFDEIWSENIYQIFNGYPFLQWQQSVEPDIASNPFPENNATAVFIGLEYLKWDYVLNPLYANPSGFRVYFNEIGYFGEDEVFVWVPYLEDQVEYSTSKILPEELEYGTIYYWKVVPSTKEHGIGEGFDAEDVPVWVFSTESKTSTDEKMPLLATELKRNYPNPFNPDTVIEVSIKEETNAALSIYNSKGQLVKTLHNGLLGAGKHRFVWDGKDFRGVDAGSGVYFYRLQSGNYDKVKRMLLVK